MEAPIDRPMGAERYLAWLDVQPEGQRYELHHDHIILMQSDRAQHARAKLGAMLAFRRSIIERGLPCEAFVDSLAVRVADDTVYEPDALARCGERLENERSAIDDPVIVVEVISPSSRTYDVEAKLIGYFRLPSVQDYLVVCTGERAVVHHRRDGADTIQNRILRAGTLALEPPGLSVQVEELLG